jgi:hypothetical protein
LLSLIDEYNTLIDKLPSNFTKPSKLDKKKKLGELCLDDDFWELDTAFKCKEKWALNPMIRKAINAMYTNLRAIEEIFLLGSEAERYYNWLASKLDRCERLLSKIDVNSAIGKEVLKVGLQHAAALVRLEGLAKVKLGGGEKFRSVEGKTKRMSSISLTWSLT